MKALKNTTKKLFCAVFALIFTVSAVPCAVSAETDVSARAAVLYEPDSNTFYYEKNADVRLPMASTTKIMTAVCALSLLDSNAVCSVPAEACNIEGSSLYLKAGDRISVNDLLYALLLRSANDAAAALAILSSGSIEAFAEEMNKTARMLSLENTHFDNPHGLDNETHYSSARDLALIMEYAMQNEIFAKITASSKHTVTFPDRAQVLYNHNKLLFLRDDVIGGKTGFTKKSGRSLVSVAKKDGVTLICVTLSAPDDWNDHSRLYDSGFEAFERKTVFTRNDAFYADVSGGEKKKVLCRPTEDFSCTVKKGESLLCDFLVPPVIYAPVSDGEIVGLLRVTQNGRILGEITVTAAENVNYKETRTNFRKFLDRLFGR
ncbi:MAG: D-alanyl-D-alanine carboxypeptidase [Clostridia bacterium]|nr:D-alanyl-D-alanine carboxypeptidase [Clostridia bacterium]